MSNIVVLAGELLDEGKNSMRTRLLVGAVAVALAMGSVAPALANNNGGSPGPNGHNTAGLCNAYSEGSATGQANKQAHGQAFIALAAAAKAWDAKEDTGQPPDPGETSQQQVTEYCAANG